MRVVCSGRSHENCDPYCVHASYHEEHPKGCMCADCNVDESPEGGVGCVNEDLCVYTKEQVKCVPV